MITLIPIQKIFLAIAILYAVAIVLIIAIFELSGLDSISVAFRGAFVLELLILSFFVFGWRRLWSRYPILNEWVYPDLNGDWSVSIHWNRENKQGTKTAIAHIKQDFFRLSMELISDESESETLMVKPKKDPESAKPLIYYIYRNESAQGVANPRPPHKGAAILKLDHNDQNLLKGNYFTDQATNGHFEMRHGK
ncbi:hypothetical protein [Nitrosococcus wardiae]|uniref:CD-NTase-associated protein 15 domain-containing protein n=1 Tax=Nitrosococcus wardiae TaxID=1814290 RepID=A0A4P7C0C9_9GAMM|nr:hypothetical protein [Nitrosococcus wardiae]QBQ56008.1 hypothetical protein E3U44_16940 [Nitrosococcus wardiae]